MKEIASLRAMNQQLEKTIHAAIEESKGLADGLVDVEETIAVLTELLRFLVVTWQEGRYDSDHSAQRRDIKYGS